MPYQEGNIWVECCVSGLGKDVLGRWKSQYKGPEVGVCLPCSGNSPTQGVGNREPEASCPACSPSCPTAALTSHAVCLP